MNVNELRKLAQWFEDEAPALIDLYTALLTPVRHNASGQQQTPLEGQLNALIEHLKEMNFQELSLEQLAVLEDRSVSGYLGKAGARFVEETIKVSNYDSTTASSRLEAAISELNQTLSALRSYSQALDMIGIEPDDFEPADNGITIRIGFRGGASIDHVGDWKESAKDWYDIVRGIALAVGEPPENTRVVGATSGSIILWLVATAGVTFLLARISKHITSIAKDLIGIEAAKENLRQQKLLTKAIEDDLNGQIEGKKASAKELVLAEVKKAIPQIDGERENALMNSVQKLLAFSRAGGDVDFVAPLSEEEGEDGEAEGVAAYLAEAREAIVEYQATRDEIRLLTDGRANDNDG